MVCRARLAGGAVILLGLLGLLGGCAPQLDRIEAAVGRNAVDLERISAEQRQLREELERLGSLFRLDQDAGVQTEAQRLAKIDQLSVQLEQLMRKLDDNNEFMRSLSARVDLLATRAGIPTLGEYKGPAGGQPPVAVPVPEEGQAIFRAAQLDRDRGNIELARDGFREFLDRYDRSELADDALYWLGDLAYGEDGFSEALDQFQLLLANYPFSNRCPAAMLKTAYCLQALGRVEASHTKLEKLIDVYPQSSEAALARERLESEPDR